MSAWISVKDEMPKYGVPVLVVYYGVVQQIAYVLDIGEWRPVEGVGSDSMPLSFVSHWMYLPDPPAQTHSSR